MKARPNIALGSWVAGAFLLTSGLLIGAAQGAPIDIRGKVQGGGHPIGQSTVTLWAAGAEAPTQLAQATSGEDGSFQLQVENAPDGASLYLVAKGGVAGTGNAATSNAAIGLLAVLGNAPPAEVTVNEFTTVASVWTHAQFIDGTAIQGHPLGLKIAAGNVPNFVDLATGGGGGAIQDSLNGPQTPTMANFATLADVLAGCVVQVTADACDRLYAAATPPTGEVPTDTLAAAQAIAHSPWYLPERVFDLVAEFYPVPEGKAMRPVPFMPYLSFAPSAWVLPLKFDGGGYRAGGGAEFDSEGNLWVGDNFTVGWQGQDTLWQGNATKFAPNGEPLSPITTGFTGGGVEGVSFGAAVDAHDNAWFSNYGGKSIAVFDKDGKPLTPPEGVTLNGQLGLMQGIIATPGGDVWALGVEKSQLVRFPDGDWTKAELVCEGAAAEPCKSFKSPFHLGVDQQDRIWVTNAAADHVVRFPASDPSKVETFKTGYSGSGLGIDSQGNVWVTNRFGSGARGLAKLVELGLVEKTGGNLDEKLTRTMFGQRGGSDGSSVSLLRPDGTNYPGSPFTGGGLPGAWAVAVDGSDNVWISNFAGAQGQIVQLCGVRTETCPPGFKTGEQISPPNGYVGGGLQMQTDIAISPAGDVWAMNNWQAIDSCFGTPPEELSTLCGGQGVTVFFGMAAPVRTPAIGPPQKP